MRTGKFIKIWGLVIMLCLSQSAFANRVQLIKEVESDSEFFESVMNDGKNPNSIYKPMGAGAVAPGAFNGRLFDKTNGEKSLGQNPKPSAGNGNGADSSEP